MVVSLGMRGVRLHTDVDDRWALKRDEEKDAERGRGEDVKDVGAEGKTDEKTSGEEKD